MSEARSLIVPRRDPISKTLFWVLLGVAVMMSWDFVGYPMPLVMTWSIIAPWVYLAYLGGWEGELEVTPDELVIRRAFQVRRVPRHLLTGVRIHTNDFGLALLLEGTDEEQLATGASWTRKRAKARQLRYADELRTAMIAIEMRVNPATKVIVQPRRKMIYFGAGLVSVAIVLICWQS